MSTDARETPRTEAKLNELHRGDPISTMGAFSEMAIFARQLERELAEAREAHARMEGQMRLPANVPRSWDEIAEENTHLRARVQELELQLTALGELAVGGWDSSTVGKVDAAVPDGLKYKDQLRALFVDVPKERDALRARVQAAEGLADAAEALTHRDGLSSLNIRTNLERAKQSIAAFRATEGRRA